MPEQRKHNVYILFDTEDYKIGYAYDVIRRLRTIQGANKNLISLIHVIDTNDMYKLEADIKRILKPCRIRGEWYRIPIPVLNNMLKITRLYTYDYGYRARLGKIAHKLESALKHDH